MLKIISAISINMTNRKSNYDFAEVLLQKSTARGEHCGLLSPPLTLHVSKTVSSTNS
jgi:hypothetical protein